MCHAGHIRKNKRSGPRNAHASRTSARPNWLDGQWDRPQTHGLLPFLLRARLVSCIIGVLELDLTWLFNGSLGSELVLIAQRGGDTAEWQRSAANSCRRWEEEVELGVGVAVVGGPIRLGGRV